jgi:hypothetical protein
LSSKYSDLHEMGDFTWADMLCESPSIWSGQKAQPNQVGNKKLCRPSLCIACSVLSRSQGVAGNDIKARNMPPVKGVSVWHDMPQNDGQNRHPLRRIQPFQPILAHAFLPNGTIRYCPPPLRRFAGSKHPRRTPEPTKPEIGPHSGRYD